MSGMEATRRATRQGTQGLSENTIAKKTIKAKGTEGNGPVAPSWETTGVEGEDDDSEYEPMINQGRAKTPRAPIVKRVGKLPRTPIRRDNQSTRKLIAAKDTAKEDGSEEEGNLREAVLALIAEIKTTKAQQDAKDKVVADGVAALRTEIAALKLDNKTLREELVESQNTTKTKLEEMNTKMETLMEWEKSIKALLGTGSTGPPTNQSKDTSLRSGVWVNPTPWSNPAVTEHEWPSLPSSEAQTRESSKTQANQKDVEALHYRERIVVVTLGKAMAEVQGKSGETLKKIAQEELQKEESTKTVQVIAASMPTQGRLEIVTASKKQAQAARENKRWVRGFGEGAKAKEATWFPLKVDGVMREELCKKEGTGWEFKDDALEIISKSNSREGFQVKAMKVHWLSRVSDKATGSIAVYFDSWTTTEQLLAEGIVLFGPTAGCPHRFYAQPRIERCYNCNQYGHRQFKCTATPKCGNCAATHQTRNCQGTNPVKCAACHGAHKVTDPRCSLYIKERERLIEQQRDGSPSPQWM